MRLLNLDEIKKMELGILLHIADFCNRNNIRYYLFYGTLLGAIRHKGFIPWDDDIDIVMPRPDYEKFILLYENENHYCLKKPGDEDYYYEFAKIFDDRTVVYEDVTNNTADGIWVDIFPLDGLSKSDKIQNGLLYFLQRSRVASVYASPPPTRIFYKPFVYLYWKLCRLIGSRYFILRITKLSQKYKFDESQYVGFAPSVHSKNKFLLRAWFDSAIDVLFEGEMFNAPKEWNECLKSLYGDYMKLPSEENRIQHRVNVYFKE